MDEKDQSRAAEMYDPGPNGKGSKLIEAENTIAFRRAGVPSGGGFASARAMAAFYQMLLAGGALNGKRVLSPRMIQYVTRNFTGERPDDGMGGIAMHRGLGPHSARHQRSDPRPRLARPSRRLRPWRRRQLLLLGRSRVRA